MTQTHSSLRTFRILVAKEWRHVLLSPKFVAACVVVAAAVLLAVTLGLSEYLAFDAQQRSAQRLLAEEQHQVTDWMALRQTAYRTADPMQIFVSGVHRDIGRQAPIARRTEPTLEHSVYGDEPIFALFRTFDLAFVVTVVLSLFAIVFTYDAVSGEREAGTLRLLMAHALPRGMVLAAKTTGLWLALLVPIALSSMLGIAVVLGVGVPMDGDAWMRLGLFAASALLYVTFFTVLGVAASANVRRSTTAFLALLAIWVLTVLVIPRAGLVAAVQAVEVPSSAQIEAQKQGFENRAWDAQMESMSERWAERNAELNALPEEERAEAEDAMMWQWMEEDDKARREIEVEIQAHADRLLEDARARRSQQRTLAFGLARISPAAAFELLAVRAAGTGVELAETWDESLRAYREVWSDWQETSSGGGGGVHVVRRSTGGGSSNFGQPPAPIDLTEMPTMTPPKIGAGADDATPFDLGLLALETLLAFALALVGFLRYDVR